MFKKIISNKTVNEERMARVKELANKNVLTPDQIIELRNNALAFVGGKNYNCAILHSIPEVRDAEFRAVSATAYNRHIDEKFVNVTTLTQFISDSFQKFDEATRNKVVDNHYFVNLHGVKINGKSINKTQSSAMVKELKKQGYLDEDGHFTDLYKQQQTTLDQMDWIQFGISPKHVKQMIKSLEKSLEQPKFVLEQGLAYRKDNPEATANEDSLSIRQFIDLYIKKTKEVLAKELSKEKPSQDALYRCKVELSLASQIAILAVEMDNQLKQDIKDIYADLNQELGTENTPISVRSSAVGEDSDDAAFAGAQDTYLNIKGEDEVVKHVQRDFASGFNIRALEYRLSQIEKELEKGATKEEALKKFDFNNIAVSVVLHRMINSGKGKSGTAFSLDPSSGLRDVVYIDSNYGYGETVVGGLTNVDNDIISYDGKLHVRTIGDKTIMMIDDQEQGGTMEVDTPEDLKFSKVLTKSEVLEISKQVQAIKNHYGKEMDTEFAIDETGTTYMIQARPETKYNELDQVSPGVIPMKRMEVDSKAKDSAKTLIDGDGASIGAASGRVRFITKAQVTGGEAFEIFEKGDILVAERTDPDFLPLFNIAGAVVANVGGRTSHAAITSRELNIPAVIGVGNLETLRKMDNKLVTVDGSSGKILDGEVKLVEVGEDIDTNHIKNNLPTKTSVGLILADVNQAKRLSQLQNIPDFKVGLLRAEFVLGNIGVHYKALKAYDLGVLDQLIDLLTPILFDKIAYANLHGKHELLTAPPILKDKAEDEVDLSPFHQFINRIGLTMAKSEVSTDIRFVVSKADRLLYEIVQTATSQITKENDNMSKTEIAQKLLNMVISAKNEITERLKRSEATNGHEYYVETLSQQIALFANSFKGKDVIYRTTDYKSNEYEGLVGGKLFEEIEDNPMLGYRGVSRLVDPWEIEAFIKARHEYGAENLHIMFPFVRTSNELTDILSSTRSLGLRRGDKGLKYFVMAEIPSVASDPHSFLNGVDGFSIGSNDLTQGILMTDRDSHKLQGTYDEEDPTVVLGMLSVIFSAIKKGKEVGFCGMGVSNSEFIAAMVAVAGISSASATPDVYKKTKEIINEIEQSGLSIIGLGKWMDDYKSNQMQQALTMLSETGLYSLDGNDQTKGFRINFTPKEALKWLKDALGVAYYQQKIAEDSQDNDAYKRATISIRLLKKALKPIIQANVDWGKRIKQALLVAGFESATGYSDWLNRMRDFESRIDESFKVISETDDFQHSTTFKKKIAYLLRRLRTIESEIKNEEAFVTEGNLSLIGLDAILKDQENLGKLYRIQKELELMKPNILEWAEKLNIGINTIMPENE